MGDTQDPKSLCVWLPEGDYQRATWRTVVRVFWDSSFACCLWAKKPEETWRLREPFFGFSLGTGMWEIWIYVWGYLIFFGENIYVKWIETEINPRFGVFHIQKDEARHFRNEISEAVSMGESFNAGLPLPTVRTGPMVPMVPRTMLDAGEYLAEPALWVKGWRYQGQLQVRATGPGWIWQVS